MDNVFAILLYVGVLVLMGLVKSISKTKGKKSAAAISESPAIKEEKKEDFFNFLQENPISSKTEAKPREIEELLYPLIIQNEKNRTTKTTSDASIILAEKEKSFIYEEFDLSAAIIYSEILKSPDY